MNSRFSSTLIVVLATPFFAIPARGQTTRGATLDVGSRRQLFVDESFITQDRGLTLQVHAPRKTGEMTLKAERPWEQGGVGPYSNVLKDGPIYRMWYHCMDATDWHTAPEGGSICYAESRDGIQWTRPNAGLVEYAGSRENNIVVGHGAADLKIGQDGGMVFLDPNAPPDQRFRMLNRFGALGEGLHILSSGDGIHWRVTHRSVVTARAEAGRHHLDSQNVIFWDEQLRKYVAYVRRNLFEGASQGRAIARGESDHLGDFPAVQDMPVVLAPDASKRGFGSTSAADLYTSEALKYPWADSVYLMFPQVYFHYSDALHEFAKGGPTNAGAVHTEFAASRDGIHWQRYDRRPFVPLGMKTEFDCYAARMIHGLVPDVEGTSMYMYYLGSDRLHGWDRDERNRKILTAAGVGAKRDLMVISRVVLRRDGFVSVRADHGGGEFTTPAMKFSGRRLAVNVDTSATGTIGIELQDEAGKPMPGYSLGDCDTIFTSNQIDRTVNWRGSADISSLAGKVIRMRAAMRDADLYAFQFAE